MGTELMFVRTFSPYTLVATKIAERMSSSDCTFYSNLHALIPWGGNVYVLMIIICMVSIKRMILSSHVLSAMVEVICGCAYNWFTLVTRIAERMSSNNCIAVICMH